MDSKYTIDLLPQLLILLILRLRQACQRVTQSFKQLQAEVLNISFFGCHVLIDLVELLFTFLYLLCRIPIIKLQLYNHRQVDDVHVKSFFEFLTYTPAFGRVSLPIEELHDILKHILAESLGVEAHSSLLLPFLTAFSTERTQQFLSCVASNRVFHICLLFEFCELLGAEEVQILLLGKISAHFDQVVYGFWVLLFDAEKR